MKRKKSYDPMMWVALGTYVIGAGFLVYLTGIMPLPQSHDCAYSPSSYKFSNSTTDPVYQIGNICFGKRGLNNGQPEKLFLPSSWYIWNIKK